MNLIIWLVVGGLIGWVASLIMKTDAQQGMFLNVVVGIVGAMLGGWLLAPLLGTGTINANDFSLPALGVSLPSDAAVRPCDRSASATPVTAKDPASTVAANNVRVVNATCRMAASLRRGASRKLGFDVLCCSLVHRQPFRFLDVSLVNFR